MSFITRWQLRSPGYRILGEGAQRHSITAGDRQFCFPNTPSRSISLPIHRIIFLFLFLFLCIFALFSTMRMSQPLSALQAFLIFLNLRSIASSALSQQATCYYPNGDVATEDFACFLDQEQSACCGRGSICEATGLCKVAGSIGVSDLVRGSCTDKTWTSPECITICSG